MENQVAPPSGVPATLAPDPRARSAARRNRTITAIAVAIVAVLAWQSYDSRQQLRELRAGLATRLGDSDKTAQEARTLAKEGLDKLYALKERIGALDAKVAEAQGQSAALEALYAELSRARDERAVTEIEQAVSIAAQQLQLAGNVPAALAALQSADSRLALLDQARFLPLRKLLARDIERLKALPLADASSMALRLETIIGRIDRLPLGFEHTPPLPAKPGKSSPAKPAAKTAVSAPAAPPATAAASQPNMAQRLLQDFWGDFRQLIRIERLDRAEPALLAPQQTIYLRENLRLRLLSARLALLQRDGKLFAEDVRQAREWLQRYFDVEAPAVADTLTELRQMEATRLTLTLPSLEETQTALRNLKPGGKH